MSGAPPLHSLEELYGELWVSLASLLRSYTAVHGLSRNRTAMVELSEEKILVRHGGKWLELARQGAAVAWKREDGSQGTLELTQAGTLRGLAGEDEMDMAAEAWAGQIMRESHQ